MGNSLGLATEWIEINMKGATASAGGGLGLATEWIEIRDMAKYFQLIWSRSCDRVD